MSLEIVFYELTSQMIVPNKRGAKWYIRHLTKYPLQGFCTQTCSFPSVLPHVDDIMTYLTLMMMMLTLKEGLHHDYLSLELQNHYY